MDGPKLNSVGLKKKSVSELGVFGSVALTPWNPEGLSFESYPRSVLDRSFRYENDSLDSEDEMSSEKKVYIKTYFL